MAHQAISSNSAAVTPNSIARVMRFKAGLASALQYQPEQDEFLGLRIERTRGLHGTHQRTERPLRFGGGTGAVPPPKTSEQQPGA
jgi:hypothetical protein